MFRGRKRCAPRRLAAEHPPSSPCRHNNCNICVPASLPSLLLQHACVGALWPVPCACNPCAGHTRPPRPHARRMSAPSTSSYSARARQVHRRAGPRCRCGLQPCRAGCSAWRPLHCRLRVLHPTYTCCTRFRRKWGALQGQWRQQQGCRRPGGCCCGCREGLQLGQHQLHEAQRRRCQHLGQAWHARKRRRSRSLTEAGQWRRQQQWTRHGPLGPRVGCRVARGCGRCGRCQQRPPGALGAAQAAGTRRQRAPQWRGGGAGGTVHAPGG